MSGNSNNTDFLLYDLEKAVIGQLNSVDTGRKKVQSLIEQTKGVLRTEIRLTKAKAIRLYTKAANVPEQIVALIKNSEDVFMETFARVIPFGDFNKKDAVIILSGEKYRTVSCAEECKDF